jgi:hypothetical protein
MRTRADVRTTSANVRTKRTSGRTFSSKNVRYDIPECNRPLSKMNEAKDCPDAVKASWEKFVTTKENAQTSDEVRCSFEKK